MTSITEPRAADAHAGGHGGDRAASGAARGPARPHQRAEARRAADPGRKPFFPSLLTPDDAGELPRLASLSDRWEEVTAGYDVAAQLEAVVDGLLARRVTPG
ncbi:hypothetical protein ACIHAR_15845 [Streptomyces sp. NPDC052016]|uniref:hypothetical protein n=1 Tax=Streptomyces sp. NPDC052016 TaxID=3365680 RepID=UPI0037D44002